jgi:hypothetical protein
MSCHAMTYFQYSCFLLAVYNSALLHAIRLISEFDCIVFSYPILSHRIVSHHHIHVTYGTLPGVERKMRGKYSYDTAIVLCVVWCGVALIRPVLCAV